MKRGAGSQEAMTREPNLLEGFRAGASRLFSEEAGAESWKLIKKVPQQ